MPILRRKLRCHYCGGTQAAKYRGIIQTWTCNSCGSDNHVDEDGQITDPPAKQAVQAPQFAHPIAAISYRDSQGTEPPIFCSNCIKNQNIQYELLSQYLPSPDDPNYAECEASLDSYRQRLEEDYPQVCIDCESRVSEQIQQAEYQAKSDNLKRMMDQSRKHRYAVTYGWRHYIIWIGMAGYYSSIIIQLVWSFLVLVTDSQTSVPIHHVSQAHYSRCLHQLRESLTVEVNCANLGASMVGYALSMSFVTIWWNPRWRHKIEGRRGRLRGLKDFYQLQIGCLVARFIAWVWLQDLQAESPMPIVKSIHVFLTVVNILLALAPWYSVKVEKVPALIRQTAPLVPDSVRARQMQERRLLGKSVQAPRPFPLSKLADVPPLDNSIHWAPTPPLEHEPESDLMEWEPTHNLQIRREQPLQPAKSQRSPFYGRLPPQPNNHRLNPHPYAGQIHQRDSIGLAPGFFDPPVASKSSTFSAQGNDSTARCFAEPTFFAPTADSGLEGVFGRVFNLEDQPSKFTQRSDTPADAVANEGPASVTTARAEAHPLAMPKIYAPSTELRSLHIIFMVLLALALGNLFVFSSPLVAPSSGSYIQNIAIIALSGLIALSPLISRSNAFAWKGTMLFTAEFTATIAFGLRGVAVQCNFQGKDHLLLCGFIAILFWQEFYLALSAPSYKVSMPVTSIPVPAERAYSAKGKQRDMAKGRKPTAASTRDVISQGGLDRSFGHVPSKSSSSQLPPTASASTRQNIFSNSPSTSSMPNFGSSSSQGSFPPSTASSFTHKPPFTHIPSSQTSDTSRIYQRRGSHTTDTSSLDSETSTAPSVTTMGMRTPKFTTNRDRTLYSPGTGLGGLSLEESRGPPSSRLRSRARFEN
ncbi:MAG: hypothetical protein Q9227_006573 [Pyrenula ochraceoflavens]